MGEGEQMTKNVISKREEKRGVARVWPGSYAAEIKKGGVAFVRSMGLESLHDIPSVVHRNRWALEVNPKPHALRSPCNTPAMIGCLEACVAQILFGKLTGQTAQYSCSSHTRCAA